MCVCLGRQLEERKPHSSRDSMLKCGRISVIFHGRTPALLLVLLCMKWVTTQFQIAVVNMGTWNIEYIYFVFPPIACFITVTYSLGLGMMLPLDSQKLAVGQWGEKMRSVFIFSTTNSLSFLHPPGIVFCSWHVVISSLSSRNIYVCVSNIDFLKVPLN